MGLTTLSLERMRDHEAVTSPALKQWVEDNGVEFWKREEKPYFRCMSME